MSSSPTQRSLIKLRKDGYLCQVVERWNMFARVRQDLFGIIDIICIRDQETIGVQTTTYKNMSARKAKIQKCPHLDSIKRANWKILLHGWRKNTSNRWEVKDEVL